MKYIATLQASCTVEFRMDVDCADRRRCRSRMTCKGWATFEATGKLPKNIGLRHVSGKKIFFGEHKGGVSFWTHDTTLTTLEPEFQKDLLELLTYLVSDTCAHPYDGLVAGSVA